MKKFTYDKGADGKESTQVDIRLGGFYKNVLKLTIPIALQNIVNVGVSATDVFMLSRVSEQALSGASLASQIQFVLMLIFFGLGSGATVLTAQYWGKKDLRSIEKVLAMTLFVGLLVAIVFAAAAFFIPNYLMRIFTSDAMIIQEGAQYLRIVSFSYIFITITTVYLLIMRSIERVIVATTIYLLALILNIILNAILIFGLLGFPALGIVGAGIATLIARFLELVMVLGYAYWKNKLVRIRIRYILQIDRVLALDLKKYATPVLLNEIIWGVGIATTVAIIGQTDDAAVAANAIANVVRQLATVLAFGVCSVAAIYVGKTIGEKKYDHAKAYGKEFVKLSLITGIFGGVLIMASLPLISRYADLTVEARGYLTFMFWVMAYMAVAQGLNATIIVGILRAGGDNRFGVIIELVTLWGVSIVFGALGAFVFSWSVPVIFLLLRSDELVKLPFTLKRFYSYKWLKNVTRE